MGKFKKGDRVKLVDCGNTQAGYGLKAGSVGTVNEDESSCPYVIYDDAVGLVATNEDRLELLPVAEATGITQDEIGKAREIPGIKSNTTTRTPLTIEAGKYYRTRDGRKVGPMYRETPNGQYLDQSESITTYGWHDNGTYIHGVTGAIDLIAEWVDVPQTEPTLIKTQSIVALIDNGQPMPAVRPLLHYSKENAEKEAERLSQKHRGKEFGVFTLISKHQTVAVYNREWQRLAANGNKIGAIKAIRELTGFGLKASKDGLEDWLSRNAA